MMQAKSIGGSACIFSLKSSIKYNMNAKIWIIYSYYFDFFVKVRYICIR